MSRLLRHQVGQLLIVGLEGPVLTATEKAWLKLIRPAGVILFRRNIEEANQVLRLLRDATEAAGHTLFRCVDLEGGLVDRLRDLVAPMPSAAKVFATGKPASYRKHGRLIAREARLLGFNTVFAPVLDLALPGSAPVMRTRVVSPHPADVIAYASEFLTGLTDENILGCGKHFPGLGGGAFDSHLTTPHIDRTPALLWKEDLAPYCALAGQLPMVMVSHAIYPKASGPKVPASVSHFWITTVLRNRIGYKGLVVSDDMEMGGILSQYGLGEAAIQAVAAGTHLVEICKDPGMVLGGFEALLAEAEKSKVFLRKVQEAAAFVRRFERRLDRTTLSASIKAPRIEALHKAILQFSEEKR